MPRSKATDIDKVSNQSKCDEIVHLRKEQEGYIGKMKGELQAMLGSFKKQKNVNNVVKRGVPRALNWIVAIEQDQKLIQKLEGQYPQAMLQAEKSRQERQK